MKKIAWGETFIMYVNADFKISDTLISELEKAGFFPKILDKGDDHEIQVTVTIENCNYAKEIIKKIIL